MSRLLAAFLSAGHPGRGALRRCLRGALLVLVPLLPAGTAETTLTFAGVALDAETARAVGVVALTLGNLLMAALNAHAGLGWRAWLQPSARALWAVSALACAALLLGLSWPGARALLHFGMPPLTDLAWGTVAVLGCVWLGQRLAQRAVSN